MARCDPNEAIPRTCAEAFSAIRRELGEIRKTGEATHEQTVRTNGHVERLFERTHRNETQIQLLQADFASSERGRARWGRRIWQAIIGLALLLAGYLLKS
jgi:hypothetical protein